jgi:tetratricopeptide (TPR) repeat protein
MNYFGVASRLGEAYVTAGRIDDAVPLLEDVVNRGRALGAISDYLLAMGPLAEAYAALGQYDGVLALARDAVHLAGTHGFRGLEAHALRYLGTLHARAELFDAEIAERRTRQALVLAEELRMRPLQAHCHLGLGKLYRRPGRLDEARAELATAVGMLREMGMAFWLPEAERELAAARR